MAEQLPESVRAVVARTQAVLNSGRLSPADRARVMGLRIALPFAKETRITVDCRTGERTIEPMVPVAVRRNPFNLEGATEAAAIMRKAPWAMTSILKAVSAAFDIPVADIIGRARSIRESRPRFAAYRLLAEAGYSRARIGRTLRRDHTSISSGLARAELLHATDLAWRENFDRARANLTK